VVPWGHSLFFVACGNQLVAVRQIPQLPFTPDNPRRTATMNHGIYDRKVSDIMTRDVVTLAAGGTVHEALSLMGENRVSAIPVVDHAGKCVGIISTTDLVDMTRDVDDDLYQLDLVDATSRRFLIDRLAHSLGNESIETYMSESLVTVYPESTLATATKRILKAGVHHLPVVDKNDRLVGIVSSLDILAEFADAAPEAK
jgi:CBS domain-containing protein